MPQQSSPPYGAAATSEPKLIDRWLDINPQNGPLRRVETFVTLPVFSQQQTWRGYSDIIAAFNFEGPNNFSLKLDYVVPVSPNYVLCVMWIDQNRNVNRYSLWRNVGEVIFFDIPEYTGQLIRKNFRLEVWSTPTNPASQVTALTFYTSVLGSVDYRYGTDSVLVNPDAIVTDFNNIPSYLIPTEFGLVADWSGLSGVNPISGSLVDWVDNIGGRLITPDTDASVSDGDGVAAVCSKVSLSNVQTLTGATTGLTGINSFVFIFRIKTGSTSGQILLDTTSGVGIYYSTSTNTFMVSAVDNEQVVITHNEQNVWYIAVVSGYRFYLYPLGAPVQKGASSLDFTYGNLGDVQINPETINPFTSMPEQASVDILELAFGTGSYPDESPLFQATADYFVEKYNFIASLPIQFPPNSVPQPNNI